MNYYIGFVNSKHFSVLWSQVQLSEEMFCLVPSIQCSQGFPLVQFLEESNLFNLNYTLVQRLKGVCMASFGLLNLVRLLLAWMGIFTRDRQLNPYFFITGSRLVMTLSYPICKTPLSSETPSI